MPKRGAKPTHFETPVLFGPDFLRDHAGQIMSDGRIAVVELVANAYDAGASRVCVQWPLEHGDSLVVEDNGTGMTPDQFQRRWRTLGYRRTQEQGTVAEFPADSAPGRRRVAFGQSGKGRHGAFCFADEYDVETWRDGTSMTVRVSRTQGGCEPFHFGRPHTSKRVGHGTRIEATASRNVVSLDDVVRAIGSKFLVDPSFAISVNGRTLELLNLAGVDGHMCDVPNVGTISVLHIDSQSSDRTTQLRGVTWWVNDRMVGTPSWNGLDDHGAVLDGRSAEAKRFSYVVKADVLHGDVKPDWTGFFQNERVATVQSVVREHIIRDLNTVLAAGRKERKKAALVETKEVLGSLSPVSRRTVGQFADQLLATCPSLSQGDLSRALTLFANIEQSRTGFDLLAELAACGPDDLDRWARIMQRWTASDAEAVLGELQWRLELLAKLQTLVEREEADELHELQPLFERGLWIFGPEFESVEFRSNRSLATVIRDLLGGTNHSVPRDRPDFVAVPGRSIGLYSADSYDSNSEVNGIAKVLVVELKHGGSMLTSAEVRQPEDYVTHLRKGHHVQAGTKFVAFVLGALLSDDAADERRIGEHLIITPMKYCTLLQRAHARTFNLLKKVTGVFPATQLDTDVEAVLAESDGALFDKGAGSHRLSPTCSLAM